MVGCACPIAWLRVCALKLFRALFSVLVADSADCSNVTCVRPARFRRSKLVLVLLNLCLWAELVQTCPITKRYVCAAKSFEPFVGGVVAHLLQTPQIVKTSANVSPNRLRLNAFGPHRRSLVNPDPSQAAKRYARNGFCVSAACSRNVMKTNEIQPFPMLLGIVSASPAAKPAWV